MKSWFKRLFDVNKMLAELDEAQAKIEMLERLLERERGKPSFAAVSTGFDVSMLDKDVKAKVIDDLAEILSRAAIDILREGFRGIERHYSTPQRMSAQAAYDTINRAYVIQFDMPSAHTIVHFHHRG